MTFVKSQCPKCKDISIKEQKFIVWCEDCMKEMNRICICDETGNCIQKIKGKI